jgi:hypothetical protein
MVRQGPLIEGTRSLNFIPGYSNNYADRMRAMMTTLIDSEGAPLTTSASINAQAGRALFNYNHA